MPSKTHERLKLVTAKEYSRRGYSVELEKKVESHIVDVYAENDNEIVLIEIVHTNDKPSFLIKASKRVRFVKIFSLFYFFNLPRVIAIEKQLEKTKYYPPMSKFNRFNMTTVPKIIREYLDLYNRDLLVWTVNPDSSVTLEKISMERRKNA